MNTATEPVAESGSVPESEPIPVLTQREQRLNKTLEGCKISAISGDLADEPRHIVPHILNSTNTALDVWALLPNFDTDEARRVLDRTMATLLEIANAREDMPDIKQQIIEAWKERRPKVLEEKLGDLTPFADEEE